MASEDLFEEDFSEEIINDLDDNYANEELVVLEDSNAIEHDNQEADAIEATEEISDDIEQQPSDSTDSIAQPTEIASAIKPAAASNTESKLFQLPMTRIRNIMKLDPDLHIASNEAVFCVTRATELFIESLARESYSFTAQAKKKTVQKRDVNFAIEAVDSLMFLEGALNF